MDGVGVRTHTSRFSLCCMARLGTGDPGRSLIPSGMCSSGLTCGCILVPGLREGKSLEESELEESYTQTHSGPVGVRAGGGVPDSDSSPQPVVSSC